MSSNKVEIGQIDRIEVTHADGSKGVTRLKVIGVAKNPAPALAQPAAAEAAPTEPAPAE